MVTIIIHKEVVIILHVIANVLNVLVLQLINVHNVYHHIINKLIAVSIHVQMDIIYHHH